MKYLNRKTITLAAVATLLLASGIALAQGPGAGRFGDGRGRGGGAKLAERLDLNDEQQEAIAKLRETNREQNLELRKQLMRLRNEFEGELLADEPGEKKLLQLVDEIGELKTEMQANRLKTRLAVRELLTPEQRDKMLGLGKRGARFGRGGRGGCSAECDGHGAGRRGRRGKGAGHGPRDGCRADVE